MTHGWRLGCYEEILAKEQSVSLKSLAVTGSDLIVMG